MISNSRKLAGAIVFSFLFAGIFDACFPKYEETSAIVHGLFIAIALSVWCGLHAEDENIDLPRGARFFCFLFSIIGVAVYLFRAFGFQQGGLKLLFGLLAAGVSGAFYVGAFQVANMFL